MPKPKKPGVFNPAPLVGEQKISLDGETITVGGRVFKRTVLPSIATASQETVEVNNALEELDNIAVQEQNNEEE